MEFQINEKSLYVSEMKAEPCFLTQGGGLAPFLLFLFPGTSGNIRLFDIDVRLTWCLNAAKRDRAAQFPFQRLTLVPPLETTLALIRPHREWVQNIKYKKKNLSTFCTVFCSLHLSDPAHTLGSDHWQQRGRSVPPPTAVCISCLSSSSLYNFTVWPGQKPPGQMLSHSWPHCWAPQRLALWLNKNLTTTRVEHDCSFTQIW